MRYVSSVDQSATALIVNKGLHSKAQPRLALSISNFHSRKSVHQAGAILGEALKIEAIMRGICAASFLPTQVTILFAISKLFFSINMKCPLRFNPTVGKSNQSTATPACFRYSTVQESHIQRGIPPHLSRAELGPSKCSPTFWWICLQHAPTLTRAWSLDGHMSQLPRTCKRRIIEH